VWQPLRGFRFLGGAVALGDQLVDDAVDLVVSDANGAWTELCQAQAANACAGDIFGSAGARDIICVGAAARHWDSAVGTEDFIQT
jgi:hypothetical protein